VKPAKVSRKARLDLEKIRDTIAKDNPEAAARVWNAFLDTADLLADNVEAGVKIINAPTRHTDVRWFVIPRFRNYLIFYRPHEDSILVLRVLHAARDWTRFFGDVGAKPES
jgi:plasmid stabilization system protein ParE